MVYGKTVFTLYCALQCMQSDSDAIDTAGPPAPSREIILSVAVPQQHHSELIRFPRLPTQSNAEDMHGHLSLMGQLMSAPGNDP